MNAPRRRLRDRLAVVMQRRVVRYLLVGIVNTAFGYSIYAMLLALGLPYPLANGLALIVGIFFSFQTQGRLVFGNHDRRLIFRYALAWALIYVVNIGLIAQFTRFGYNAYVAGAMALVPVVVISYFVQKTLVFRPVDSGIGKR